MYFFPISIILPYYSLVPSNLQVNEINITFNPAYNAIRLNILHVSLFFSMDCYQFAEKDGIYNFAFQLGTFYLTLFDFWLKLNSPN